jgi:hypothetical protein
MFQITGRKERVIVVSWLIIFPDFLGIRFTAIRITKRPF